ncbi:hypothetical protein [Flavonifractor plautii]|uniref:hypothetical protein n=1 Tax=Flavonifractor plautii TaxID=292800 RepID=UPI003EEA3C52
MRSDRLFSRDFTLMVAGQIISLFGNAILRFALSLYVLDTTGSAAVFGGILAVSMVPTILCSPWGASWPTASPGSASCGDWTSSPPPWCWGTACSLPAGARFWPSGC